MKELVTIEEWKEVLEQSHQEPILLLKHSTTCPISTHAYSRFDEYETTLPKFWLKVRESRPVSNEVENDLGVTHQSPQAFIVKDGKQLWNASHTVIMASEIDRGLQENGLK